MSTTDELLEEMLEDVENVEEYATPVTDDDLQFWIDEHLRVISIPKNGVVAGVEGDKNVNKIKFGMNRYYHGFDMSTFSGRILYSNAKGNKNYYNITDMQASGSAITFSWLVDADAVQYMGKTAFVVYLFKTQGSELRQKFYSTLATLNVLEGMEVDSAVPVEKQTDIIERMKEEISAYAEEVKKSLPADYTAMTEQVSSLKEDIGTPKSIKSSWFNAPYTCYPISELACVFSTPKFNKKYPFGTFVAKTEYDAGTITTDGTSITLKYKLTNNIAVDETNGLCAIIENNAGVSYEISITDDNGGRFGSTLYSGTLEKGSNIIPLAGNTYACTYLYMLINGHSSISAAELNSIKFSLAKVDNMTYPNTISRKHVIGAPYTCYPMSELVCMFSTPQFNKKYPFGTFVAKTEYDAGTITTDGTSITLKYKLTNNIAVDETNGLCAIIENNASVSYEISITDDNGGRFGSTLYNGTLEKGSNIIPLAGNTYACTYLYMLINGHSSISAAELNSIKFSLAKVPNISPMTPTKQEQLVAFIGDSLTAQGYYTKMKAHDFKHNVYAVGGQGIAGILSRTNTIDLQITSPTIITNDAELIFVNGAPINNQGNGNIGALMLNGNVFNIEYTADNKVIAKNVKSPITNSGETIKTSICDTDFTLYVYWCGTNNMQGGNVDFFIQSFEQIIATHPNSLILGITWDTSNMGLELVKAIDEAATKKFGNRFLPLHDNIVKYGLSYNGLTPTSEDTEAINNNLIPPSLRADAVHFNAYGQTYVAHLVQERMRTLGVK